MRTLCFLPAIFISHNFPKNGFLYFLFLLLLYVEGILLCGLEEFAIPLPLPSECWDFRHESSYLTLYDCLILKLYFKSKPSTIVRLRRGALYENTKFRILHYDNVIGRLIITQ